MVTGSFRPSGLLPFLALAVVIAPLLMFGFPGGHDWIFELVRVSEFRSAVASGQLPPYWASNLYGGHGSPIFLYYAPLYLAVSSLCSTLAGSISGGSAAALVVFSLAAVLSMRWLARAVLDSDSCEGRAGARVAVCFFVLNPYLLCNMYLRNANAELAALCVSPLALYGLLAIGRRPRHGGLILAAGLALTITSHNLTALVVFASAVALALMAYLPRGNIASPSTAAASTALGLGLSAFFWVPAVFSNTLVQIDQMTIDGFDFHDHFAPITSFFGYDRFHAVGVLTPLILTVSAAVILAGWRRSGLTTVKTNIVVVCFCLVFLFLQTRASTALWESIPYMPLFQFPWRMMGPLALVTSLAAGLSFTYLCRGRSRTVVASSEALLLICCMTNAMPHLRKARPLPDTPAGQISDVLRGDQIRAHGLSATVLDEYLPRSAQPAAWRLRGRDTGSIAGSTPEVEVEVIEDTGTSLTVETNAVRAARLQVARWFFPGWECAIDGEPHHVGMTELGTVEIQVPAGHSHISLQLRPPVLRRVSLWISLASALIWCAAALTPALKSWLQRRGAA